MKFEIINPSDKCFMTANDLLIAAVAICILSEGRYGLDGVDESKGIDVPMFMFGGHDEWFKNNFNLNFAESCQVVATERKPQLIAALESIEYESERGSMNNIKQRAFDLAQSLK